MANTALNLVTLDFDTVKNNLKNFLKSQDIFKDYDFEGSNINVLLDLLAYNTNLNAFYLNMMASEMFLDSAQLRASVVSRAKELNYTPRSYKSSKALVNMQFAQSGLSVLEIPAGTTFTGKNANGSYTFVSNTSVFSYPSSGYFTVNNYPIYEGTSVVDSFTMNYGIEGQQFVLTNTNVDTDTIIVSVLENNGANTIQYTEASSLFGLDANSAVFFIQGLADTSYELVFGDNNFGRKPQDGAIILATYRISNGTDGNGCTNFTINTNLGTVNGLSSALSYTLTTANSSYNGSNSESIESIRYNAPRHYQTQERAVTTNDFKTIVLQNYTDVKAVNVYGGETVTGSVNYGKVYISPVTQSGFNLSDSEKNDIIYFLKNKCTLGITPVIVDPDYLYILVNVNVSYDPNVTNKTPSDIEAVVTAAIQQYNSQNLIDFDTTFSLSRFESAINNSDDSILSNQTKTTLRKDVTPLLNEPVTISLDFHNALIPGSIVTSQFNSETSTYVYTDYNPNLNTFTIEQGIETPVVIINTKPVIYLKDVINNSFVEAGTIDYDNGIIKLKTINVLSIPNEMYSIQFSATPLNQDIKTKQNDVIEIDIETGVNVTVTAS